MEKDTPESRYTIDTPYTGGTPTKSQPERTREQFQQDNKPTEKSRENGCSFIKPMNPRYNGGW